MSKHHRTVLVIDDSGKNDGDYQHYLCQDTIFSYQVFTERNDTSTLALCRSHPIDGILLELHSPHTSCFEFLGQLKQQMGEHCPPIVVIDSDDVEMAVQSFKNGAADYLVRERITPHDLRVAMRSAIANAESRRERQQRYQDLAEAMPQIVWIADATGNINYWNQRWYEYTGLSEAESMGVSGVSRVHPDDRDRTLAQWRQSVANGESFEIEYRIRRGDGVYHWFISRGLPTRDPQGNIIGWIGTITDIEAIKRSEQQVRRVLDSLFSFVGVITPDGVLMEVNQTALAAASLQPSDVLGQPFEQAYWWSYDTQVQRQLKAAIQRAAAGETVRYDVQVRLGVDQFIILDFALVPVLDEAGQVEYLIPSGIDISDRIQSKAELQDTQAQLQQQLAEIEAIYQSAPIGLNVLDRELRFVRINQQLADINGLPVAAHIGRTVRELLPDLADTAEQLLLPILETGEPLFNVEIEGETPAQPGVKRTWLEHFLPLKVGDSVIGISTVCEDITERKRVEAALRESEARFRNMADNAPMMVWVTDATGNCTYLSQSWYNFTGQTEAEGLGLGWLNAVHSQDRKLTRDTFLRANERHEAFRVEYRLRRQDGNYRYCIDAANPWLGEDGEFKGYIGSIIDISDRQQAEAALKEAHIQLEAALAAGSIYTWRWNIAENSVMTDRNFAHLFGVDSQQAATGLPLDQFLNAIEPEDRPQVTAEIEQAIATGEDYGAEYRVRDADGKQRWVIARGRVEYDANGNAITFPGALADISDRKQAEVALRRSEERYRTLFESIDEGFCVIKMLFDQQDRPLDYRFLEVNPMFEQQTGLKQAEGKTARQLIPNLEDYWFEIYGKVALTGEPVRFENGSEPMNRWFDVYAFRVGEPEQRNVAILFKDISDRKQAEEALKESEQRFRTLADNISQLAWMADENGWIFWYNQRWFDYTGTTLAQMQGWGWQQVHHPDYVEGVVEKISRCYETGEPWEDTFPLRGKDGQYRWFLSRALPIRDEAGNICCWFGTNTDITERKQTEEALREREQRLDLATSAAQLGVFEWDIQTDYAVWENPQMYQIFGHTLEDGTLNQAQFVGSVIHPDDREAFEQALAEGIQGNHLFHFICRIRRRHDSQWRWIEFNGQLDVALDGTPLRLVGVVGDITEQKQVEAQREQLFEQEQAAREAAERANRIKDEFLAILSHELRTPLNPILGWTKLLQIRKFDAAKTAEALAIIERNAKLQVQLIDDLLDIAKILRGKLSLEITPVNLSSVIAAAIDTVRATAVAKSISLHGVVPNIGQVSGDAARLQQIVWNLLSNAIKFTPNGGRVDIWLQRVDNQAEITVKDTGKGINPNFLGYIFESFRQEDASITRKYGGLGLGLAIVRQLVEAHGGTITVDSFGEGLGATFTVRLPLLNGESESKQTATLRQPELDLTGIRVLAVDDEPDACELLKILLTQYGADVLTVTSASQVLTTLTSFEPDVLICDIGMPDIDGYTLLQQIRALPPEKGGQIPAIALTAYARQEDQQRALNSGYQRHLPKPLEPEQLVRAVVVLAQQ
ncbi:PAS domain S-box protein [Coleofasciculus sp.]|uniref:PAS domain S-box protein n=1 Tax=Coleofasciculus sp. TaxID=3100458 RepID=UPI003A3ED5D5